MSADNPFGPVLGARYATQGARSLALGDDTIFRPNLVNSFSANYARWVYISSATPPNLFAQIPGSYGAGFPVVSFTSTYLPSTSIGDQNSFNFTPPFWNFNEALSWDIGRHSLKFGARYSDYIAQEVNGNYANGTYKFSPLETASGNSGAGDAFASYLLGNVDSASLNVQSPSNFSGQYYAFYAQDSWRAAPTLTFNVGLRWDIQRPYNAPGSDIMDKKATNPAAGNLPGAIIFTGHDGTGSRFLPTWFGGLAPRLGMAWNPSHDTVVRAGYGPGVASVSTIR